MSSIVIDLQAEALNPQVKVSDLLRKALVVAKKLNIKEFEVWTSNELHGYGDRTIPDYRKVVVQLKALSPSSGWQPIRFPDPERAELFSSRMVDQSIAELESLVSDSTKKVLRIPIPKKAELLLMKAMSYPTEIVCQVSATQLVGIIDAVRTGILYWTLKLEEDGIKGENLSFTQKEKATASAHTYNVNNFLGNVTNPQIMQDSDHSTQTMTTTNLSSENISAMIKAVRESLGEMRLERDQENELKAELQTLEAQTASPKPKQSIIKEAYIGVKRILENAVGNGIGTIAADLLLKYFS